MNRVIAYRQIRRLKTAENHFLKQVYKVLQDEMSRAAHALRTGGIDHLRAHLDTIIIIDNIGEVIRDIYKSVGVYYANLTSKQIREQKGFGNNPAWIEQILEYFRVYLLTKAVLPIAAETRRRIEQILEFGIEQGWSIDKMAYQMENDGFTIARARMITRTEILKAQFKGQEMAQENSEFETTKMWIAAHDSRTRTSHRDIDGTRIDSDDKFQVLRFRRGIPVGVDYMDGPGDPTASAENVINCRCTLAIRLKRDAKGRFIKKSKIFVALPGQLPKPRQTITI